MSKKIVIAILIGVALVLSACTGTNDKIINHATGTYYDLDHVNGDWKPLFGHLTRVKTKTKLDEGWMK